MRRERGLGVRRERYVVDNGAWHRAWSASARKNTTWADAAERGARILGLDTPAGARVRETSRFFGRLGDDMAGGPAVVPVLAQDARTVLAALACAGVPLTVDRLAGSLGWDPIRVSTALVDAVRHPDWIDPVAIQESTPEHYTITARLDRLTAVQRRALVGFRETARAAGTR